MTQPGVCRLQRWGLAMAVLLTAASLLCAAALLWSMMWDSAAIGAMSEELTMRGYLTDEGRHAIEQDYGSVSQFIRGKRGSDSALWALAISAVSLVGGAMSMFLARSLRCTCNLGTN